MTRLLANENIPLASVLRLREAGHDVLAISESWPGASDRDVLERARREARIVLTFDRDYGELIYLRGLPAPLGLVHLRFTPLSPGHVADVFTGLEAIAGLTLVGRYTVIDQERLRQRPLP